MGASLPAQIDRNPAQFEVSARRALRAAFVDCDAHRCLLLKVLLRSLSSLALAVCLVVLSSKYGIRQGNPCEDIPTYAAARKLNMNNCFSLTKSEARVEVHPLRTLSMSVTEDRKEPATEFDANFRYNEIGAATSGSFNQARRKVGMGGRSTVNFYSEIFQDLLDEGLLKTGHKVLCLGRYASREVIALKEKGVNKTIGFNRTQGSRPKQLFTDENFDFLFSAEFDNAPHPALFVSEIERTLKVGGLAAMHVSLATWRERFMSSKFGHQTKPVTLLFRHSKIVYVSAAHAPGLDTIIVFKKSSILRTNAISNERKNDDHAMPEASSADELESFSTVEGIKPTSIPDVAQPLNPELHVYVNMEARGLDHCISSWLERQNSSISDDELSACMEKDGPYQANPEGFSLYAAWTKNRSVVISKSFWFQHQNSGDEAMDMMIVEGVEFIDWLNKTVVDDDFVVMKMVEEGTNLELVYRMIETGTISLIDEIFLVCQHPSSWKDSILGETHQRSYTECSTFYDMLHNSGVVVHQ